MPWNKGINGIIRICGIFCVSSFLFINTTGIVGILKIKRILLFKKNEHIYPRISRILGIVEFHFDLFDSYKLKLKE